MSAPADNRGVLWVNGVQSFYNPGTATNNSSSPAMIMAQPRPFVPSVGPDVSIGGVGVSGAPPNSPQTGYGTPVALSTPAPPVAVYDPLQLSWPLPKFVHDEQEYSRRPAPVSTGGTLL